MAEARASDADWATTRRRRWSASRVAAALALHVLVLGGLKLAIDRVELPRHGAERVTTLVSVALHLAPPPPARALPLPRPPATAPAARPRVTPVPAPAPVRPRENTAQAITPPVPPPVEPAPAVAAAASSPPPDLTFLDNAASRRAIRAVARGDTDTLAQRGNALTKEESGSELVAADGTHQGLQRNLPPPPPAVVLANSIAAAHKGDCGKGEFIGGGMGLLSAPFLLAAEALGQCAHKL